MVAPACGPTPVNALTSGMAQDAASFVCLDLADMNLHCQGVNGILAQDFGDGFLTVYCKCADGWNGEACDQRLWPFLLG